MSNYTKNVIVTNTNVMTGLSVDYIKSISHPSIVINKLSDKYHDRFYDIASSSYTSMYCYYFSLQNEMMRSWDSLFEEERKLFMLLSIAAIYGASAEELHELFLWFTIKSSQWNYGDEFDLLKKETPIICSWDELQDKFKRGWMIFCKKCNENSIERKIL